MSGIDGHRNRALSGDRHLQRLLVAFRQVSEAGVICADGILLEVTLTLTSLVWIRVLRVNSVVILDVLIGEIHQTAIAAVVTVAGGTVDQVLLGQRHQITGGPLVLALQRAGGAERPATSTHSLEFVALDYYKRYNKYLRDFNVFNSLNNFECS